MLLTLTGAAAEPCAAALHGGIVAAWVFWGACALTLYTYGGYLLVLIVLDAIRNLQSNARYLSGEVDRRRSSTDGPLPPVSVLIAAHDEEACIRAKIENTLAFDYPADRLEILVGSDGSSDRTDEIVRSFAARGVILSAAPRAGKASVLNRLVQQARGRICLFTDANTIIDPAALRRLVRPLENPEVGGASGRLRLVTPDGAPASEGAYWRYENLLKYYESRLGSLMGANGAIYVLRRSDWTPLPPDTIVDDFVATMLVVLRGHRLVYEPEAVATEETASELTGEFRRRVRIAAGNFQALAELWPLLLKGSFSAFAFWSHKVLRWFAPLFMLAGLTANLVLLGRGGLYTETLALQLLGIMAALWPARLLPQGAALWFAFPHYFLNMNAAMALGLVRWLTGSQTAAWQRTERAPQRRAA